MEFRILEVIRGEQKILPNPRTVIQANDILLVEGKVSELIKVKETAGIEILADVKLGDKDLQSDEIKIVEALITPQSDLIDRTLKEANFRARYGMTALAIYRHGQSLREKIGRIRLRLGDLLLVQGPADRIDDLRRHPDLWIMEELSPALYRKRQGPLHRRFFRRRDHHRRDGACAALDSLPRGGRADDTLPLHHYRRGVRIHRLAVDHTDRGDDGVRDRYG